MKFTPADTNVEPVQAVQCSQTNIGVAWRVQDPDDTVDLLCVLISRHFQFLFNSCSFLLFSVLYCCSNHDSNDSNQNKTNQFRLEIYVTNTDIYVFCWARFSWYVSMLTQRSSKVQMEMTNEQSACHTKKFSDLLWWPPYFVYTLPPGFLKSGLPGTNTE